MIVVAAGWIMVAGPAVNGQAGAPQSSTTPTTLSGPVPAFDVAAIHLHNPEEHEHNSIWSSPFDGHFRAANVNAIMLIHWAFAMPDTRILGAPGWASTTWFSIEAEADDRVDQQMHTLTSEAAALRKREMVQALLADRFKLGTHVETRVLPVYALLVAKGGPRFGAVQANGTTINSGNGQIEVQGSNSVALLAEELAKNVGHVVVDKTGIEGRYNLALRWTPDRGTSPGFSVPERTSSAPDSPPSIFTALQEQLGLKLESQKGPVQVLVIDHIEMPSEN